MGSDLIGPKKGLNPWGHFESKQWHKLERELAINRGRAGGYPPWILELLGPEWGHFANLTPDGYTVREMARYVDRESNHAPMWGIKSTLWGLIFGHMSNILPPERRVVIVHRNWTDSIDSRVRHMVASKVPDVTRELAERVHSALSWGVDMFAAGLAKTPVLHVDFDQLKREPEHEVPYMLDFCMEGFDMTPEYGRAIDWIRR